ncbi:PIN domain nuclease, a component of toxin-antitoxin system (PIN domain) [Roseovarius lutimaris]|uniref:PIN domain nuclease, a component of toxin-antitoxin system (PIN domain) n=1 Tax=Roseovarius lutimaris TaxID=1005928 RepID=A0A1I5AU22_9RHOB|nr:type II toxin-antitoxin system VapC family toxin [Roseovarius lutimaris]SFN65934.1 PIN domain nuclease, a component of toxin-antitoxin system (PIN domain) [Roseovarius lutimaris]
MNLLLDTHLLLWAAANDELMSRKADRMIKDAQNRLWFSVVSLWEITAKRALGRPDFRADAGQMRAGLLANGYEELPIDGRHCLALATLPAIHGDPFDRMLIAQAATEGMTLVTADKKVAQYPGSIEIV